MAPQVPAVTDAPELPPTVGSSSVAPAPSSAAPRPSRAVFAGPITAIPAPRTPWQRFEARPTSALQIPANSPMHTDQFDAQAIEHAITNAGDDILTALSGLHADTLAQPVRDVTSAQWAAAYEALVTALDRASLSPSPVAALNALLRTQRTAYSPTEFWPKFASIVELVPHVQPAALLSNNPSNNVAGYLTSLWQQNTGVAVALAAASFWPAAGCEARYGAMHIATERVDTMAIAGLPQRLTTRTCQLSLSGSSRTIKVVHVPWPDFAALPGDTLARIAQHVESLRGTHGVAIHCGAGLGRSGTFALAQALVAHPKTLTMRDVLLGFLRLRLQRRGCIETTAQFVSVGDALKYVG